ncbi:hypothetical protein [Chthonomonas calidirosea]|uniref:hypothetical protein n=1 Tax=Chthonomonas calidirosea TaxID=454171 RepID=UPI0012E3BDF6|nr:hypothetical protein [Chthonomonas calidirosea]
MRPVLAAPPENSASTSGKKVAVVVFVHPIGDGARVGIAYDRSVPKQEVQADADRLTAAGHWHIADMQVDNSPMLPNQPPTTAALLTLQNAPQFSPAGPQIQPYLQAFQRFNTIEIDFLWPSALAQPPHVLSTPDYVETLLCENGLYRYIFAIKKHTGLLADPNALLRLTVSQPTNPPKPSEEKSGKKTEGIVLLRNVTIGGCILLLLAVAYVLSRRHR